MNIRITSDSTCDLSPDYLQAHRVELLPLYTMKGGETFRDGVDIHPQDIFDHVAAGGDLCSTAANNVSDYQELFARLLPECDAIIHIDISADFSSCYQNACVAASELPNVYVVDSRNLSSGHGHIVCEAVNMAEEGRLSPQEIVDRLNELTSRVEASFLLDRLDYMVKGGRCSMVVALGCSSVSNTMGSFFRWGIITGTISSLNTPAATASAALRWLWKANSSISSREIWNCSATFSAVSPIPNTP